MDDYYWIHELEHLLIEYLREELGKDFIRDKDMTSEAEKHSEEMMNAGCRRPTIPSSLGPGKIELTDIESAPYNQWPPHYQEKPVKEVIEKLAHKCILSEYHSALRFYQIIGVGIAVKKGSSGEAIFFSTVQLRK